MCVIYACASALPPEDELRQGAWKNDHGAGIAWLNHAKKRVDWVKGLKDEKDVLEVIKKYKVSFPLMIHFRIASVGGRGDDLTHPFPITEEVELWHNGYADSVLMHNGHLGKWEELVLAAGLASEYPFPGGVWSDSRALAWLVFLKGPGILPFVAGHSRIALLHNVPQWLPGEDGKQDPWDYFTIHGDWVGKREEGWLQSTTTTYANRGGKVIYSGNSWEELEAAEAEELPTASKPASSPASNVTPLSSEAVNVWSISELNDVIGKLKKELADARAEARC